MTIKATGRYLLDQSLGRFVCSGLKSCLRDPEFSKTVHNGITIYCANKDVDDSFIKCVISALSMIGEISPKLTGVVSRNLEHIIGDRPSHDNWLAQFQRQLKGCRINWNQFDPYTPSIKNRIMAAAIVHEAYHGECYRVYGHNAYDQAPFERICRQREIRVLQHFISMGDESMTNELSNRIATLNN